MEMQNIQSVLKQYGLSVNHTNAQNRIRNLLPAAGADSNVLQVDFFEFKLEAQIFTAKEVEQQGEKFNLYSLGRIDISITELHLSEQERQDNANGREAAQPFDQDGYWGIDQTSERLAQFVILGGSDNIEKLRQGREGILKGFKEAEEIWSGKLPKISYQTIDKALEKIDARIHELGQPVIDTAA